MQLVGFCSLRHQLALADLASSCPFHHQSWVAPSSKELFASLVVSLLDLGIKIPLAPAQGRLSAGPQVHPWAIRELCHTVLVIHNQLDGIPKLFTSLLAVVCNKCQLPCLPPLYQTVF